MGISNSVHTWYEWLRVHDLSTAEVFSIIKGDGQEPHYAYEFGNDRLSCVFCLFGSKGDLRNGRRHYTELLQQYAAMEQHTGYTMHMSRIPLVELTTRDEANESQLSLFSN
ncbi:MULTISPECIES: hypothetical protein [Pseudomonas]|uniref:hypothetical protein n=1 Tax=Pseudomonas mosselii TaxID=78327 RepID=UPI001F0E9FA7|nr:hypothetical protein [Pseudomonas mosselii]